MLVVLGLGVVARATDVTETELDVSRWLVAAPDLLARPLWLVMQAGSVVGGLVVGTVVLGLLGGVRWVAAGLITVLGAWGLAKVVKDIVDRGRPADYLASVNTRFEPVLHGGGYVSGHTAVAFALATVVSACLPSAWRWAPYVLAAVVGVGRIYFGAHLALDVIGGAALGLAVGLGVRWACGVGPRHEVA